MENLIAALRCSADPSIIHDCMNCEYKIMEKVDKNIPVGPDIVIDGEAYWVSCDCDRITLEAADQLEQVFYGHQTNECRKGV